MNRRQAIQTVAVLTGGTVVGAQAFLAGCATDKPDYDGLLNAKGYEQLMDEVAETILPATEQSPGAKEARVGRFMNVMVTECYDEVQQKTFLSGIKSLNQKAKKDFGKRFMKLPQEQKQHLLLSLEAEAANYSKNKASQDPETHYYHMMKQLALLGFLTSEIGVTKAMRHVPIPARFDPCIPCKEGDKAWA